jgi:hypothetical protein
VVPPNTTAAAARGAPHECPVRTFRHIARWEIPSRFHLMSHDRLPKTRFSVPQTRALNGERRLRLAWSSRRGALPHAEVVVQVRPQHLCRLSLHVVLAGRFDIVFSVLVPV